MDHRQRLTYTGTGANNRLAGKDTTPDFTITFPAITNLSSVVITNVIFGFGESPNYGWNSITVPVETPEPDAAILVRHRPLPDCHRGEHPPFRAVTDQIRQPHGPSRLA